MSLAASPDADAFVAAFQDDDRLVVDYLTEEFLSGISTEDRDRLLRTSILNKMCGPLVDALCDTADGAAWLRSTTATNQLVIALDRTGTWYRYRYRLSRPGRIHGAAGRKRLRGSRTTTTTDDITYVSPAQVAVDCLTGPGRMPDEGEALVEWMSDKPSRWQAPSLARDDGRR